MTLRPAKLLRNAIALLGVVCVCALLRADAVMAGGVFLAGLLGIVNFAAWTRVGQLLLSPEADQRSKALLLWGAKFLFIFGGVGLLLSQIPAAAVMAGLLVVVVAILIEALAIPPVLATVEEA